MIRGLRSVRKEVHDIIAAGRSLKQQIEDIKREGMLFTPMVLRNSIIGGLEIRLKEKVAENLIIIGCACFGTALPLRSFCLLLQRLGISYTFLEKEYCCGAPLINQALLQGEDREEMDEIARDLIKMNLEQAEGKGVKNIIFFCTWCAYLAKRFFPKEKIPLLFYPEILMDKLDGGRLELKAKVGYFGGRPHRLPVYIPQEDVDLQWREYRQLLQRIKGLQVIDIPRYCCQIAPWAIFQRMEKFGLDTLVIPCIVCYGRLIRVAPSGIKVKFLSDILLQALKE